MFSRVLFGLTVIFLLNDCNRSVCCEVIWNNFVNWFDDAFKSASLVRNSTSDDATPNISKVPNLEITNVTDPTRLRRSSVGTPEEILGPLGNTNAQSTKEGREEDWTTYFQYMYTRDNDTCLSRFICEVVSRPWNFGEYGWKVQRFFFVFTPTQSDEAGSYYKKVATLSAFTWNCASQYPMCTLNDTEIQSLGTGHKLN